MRQKPSISKVEIVNPGVLVLLDKIETNIIIPSGNTQAGSGVVIKVSLPQDHEGDPPVMVGERVAFPPDAGHGFEFKEGRGVVFRGFGDILLALDP